MWTKRLTLWRFMLCALFAVTVLAATARGDEDNVPSESQCRPYIEKALKKGLESGDAERDSIEQNDSSEVSADNDSKEARSGEKQDEESSKEDDTPSVEVADEPYSPHKSSESLEAAAENDSNEEADGESKEAEEDKSNEEINEINDDGDSKEQASADEQSTEKETEEQKGESDENDESQEKDDEEKGDEAESKQVETDEDEKSDEGEETTENEEEQAGNEEEQVEEEDEQAGEEEEKTTEEEESSTEKEDDGSQEKAESGETAEKDSGESTDVEEEESAGNNEEESTGEDEKESDKSDSEEQKDESEEKTNGNESTEIDETEESDEKTDDDKGKGSDDDEDEAKSGEAKESDDKESGESDVGEEVDDKYQATEEQTDSESQEGDETEEATDQDKSEDEDDEEGAPEEDLLLVPEIPENLRSRKHIHQILRLDEDASENELTVEKSADIVLRDLKRLYEGSIKPLEGLYKYRDLSNRHFGDPEIFSKPLVLFMGPWSGGKSSILNYLTGLEFTEWSLRTGAEPSPAYFNILMHGKEPTVLDGTQLAADWTFSGLQKFGQGLEERLRGLKYPSKLLEKVNIVEIPGILEVRKQVSRVFPFNDACQWFIDRADIIFLVYDPSKLDVGPETEAILDQLKGRESQTRILLNKADTVKPEELLRVQSALIWNISPLMSSAQPPVMYTASLWSMPYEAGAPARLLQAQERELLRDLRHAIDKRIENKIASARRFAVRVRNHAKMVDCYLTTYFNHKTIFGNKKLIADAIIENPQNYHIYEGLSTLTNISRYDLPDPETYRDFFRLNPLYEFQQLSATCTYFRGCPINRLDVAIAYDLPELVGRYKKMVETATPQGMPKS